jgi:integral membrane protein (TIGR01906 family)
MLNNKFLQSLITILLAIAVPILLVLGSIRLVMTDAYLNLEYNKPDFPVDEYGFTLEDRLYYAPFALNYLLNDAEIDYLGDLRMSDSTPFYQPDELKHMIDVKIVMRAAMFGLALIIALFVLAVILLTRSQQGREVLRRGLFSGGLLTLALLGGLVLFVLLAWDTFFTQFHNLFFASGTWTFDYSDSLIRLFPIRFWQDAALTVGAMSGVGALLIIAITVLMSRRQSA